MDRMLRVLTDRPLVHGKRLHKDETSWWTEFDKEFCQNGITEICAKCGERSLEGHLSEARQWFLAHDCRPGA